MPPLQKDEKNRQDNSDELFLSEINGFDKAQFGEMENSTIFHGGMVKKIDTLLRGHEKKTILEELISAQKPMLFPEEPLIELRTPLSKKVKSSTFQMGEKPEVSVYKKLTMPDEFKTEFFTIHNPSFRFVSTLDSRDDVLQIRKPQGKHVEVINLSSLAEESGVIQKKIESVSEQKKDTDTKKRGKVEIIQTKKMGSNKCEDTASTKASESEENYKKSRIYYLAENAIDDKKLKKLDKKHSYIPVDLNDKRKKFKEIERRKLEKQQLAEKKRKEKERLEREAEENRLKKLEEKKAKLEKRQSKKEEKKALLEKLKKEAEEKKHEKLNEKQERKRAKKKIKTYEFEEKNDDVITKNQKISDEPMFVNDDVIKVLLIIDDLLGELPESVINRFAQSKDFELYKKVIIKYKSKGEL